MFRQMVQEFVGQLSELDLFLQYMGVFVISFVPFVESPGGAVVGSLIGIPIILAVIISMIGNWISIMFVILPFNALFTKIRDRNSTKEGFIHNRATKARERYDKYGVPGLAHIAPLFASAHIAAFTSLAAGANKRRVIFWHSVSIGFWGILGGVLGGYLNYDLMQ
ncbi:small multi-drug export protein [Lysinibacillus sp. NPDC092081]|uniref:small multi-drug export protein n=1 Tax=Lysinibacillus sp. NPDC092081 TaxID=3364131 RepID=UPI00381626C5